MWVAIKQQFGEYLICSSCDEVLTFWQAISNEQIFLFSNRKSHRKEANKRLGSYLLTFNSILDKLIEWSRQVIKRQNIF